MIKEIVEKVFAQAEKGKIVFGEGANIWTYKIKFYANIENNKKENVDDKYLVIDIPNYKRFLEKVENYLNKAAAFYKNDQMYFGLSDKAYKEELFAFLMLNMSPNDAQNVYRYIDIRTEMLEKNLESFSFSVADFEAKVDKRVFDVWVGGSISKNRSSLEAPFKMLFMCMNAKGEQFNLPAITFGVADDVAYVYAVQSGKVKQAGDLAKDLDRYFRKLNKGVETDEVVAKVSPNFLAALTLFCSYLKKVGVKKIVARDVLPARYTTAVDAPKNESAERQEKVDCDQYNITNKFMYLFLRYNYHFPSNVAEYDDIRGEMNLSLVDEKVNDDHIIYMLDKSVDKRKQLKSIVDVEKENEIV